MAAGAPIPAENGLQMPDDSFHVYDTTLRDGAQQEGLSLTVADKLAIARRLDEFGVGFIEGGWPGRSEERRVGKECRSRWSPYH